jgi:hypothetical protein
MKECKSCMKIQPLLSLAKSPPKRIPSSTASCRHNAPGIDDEPESPPTEVFEDDLRFLGSVATSHHEKLVAGGDP